MTEDSFRGKGQQAPLLIESGSFNHIVFEDQSSMTDSAQVIRPRLN